MEPRLAPLRVAFAASGILGLFCCSCLLLAGLHVPRLVLLSLLGTIFATAHLYLGLEGRSLLVSNPSFVVRVLHGTLGFLVLVPVINSSMVSGAAVVDIGAAVGIATTWALLRKVRRLAWDHDGPIRPSPVLAFDEIPRIMASIRSGLDVAAWPARIHHAWTHTVGRPRAVGGGLPR